MVQPIPPGVDPVAYALRLAANTAAINTIGVFPNLVPPKPIVSPAPVIPPKPVEAPPPQARSPTPVVSPVPIIPPTPVEAPPPQVNRDASITNTIAPTPVIDIPSITPAVIPPQVDRGTITNPVVSTPSTSIFSSAKPLVILGIALFVGVSLFVSPKASKRK